MKLQSGVFKAGIPTQHIATAAALAVAVAALIGIGTWRDTRDKTPVASAAIIRLSPESSEGPREIVRFLVASEEQAAEAAASLQYDLNPSWFSFYSFAVVSNEEDRLREVRAMGVNAMELLGTGVSARVVDLRSRS